LKINIIFFNKFNHAINLYGIFLLKILIFFIINIYFLNAQSKIQIKILGIPQNLLYKIYSNLDIKKFKLENNQSNLLFKKNMIKNQNIIISILKSEGYYESKIINFMQKKKNEKYKLIYKIYPGKPILIDKLSIKIKGSGKSNKNLKNILNSYKDIIGTKFVVKYYQDLKKKILKVAKEEGFLQAFLTKHIIKIDIKKHKAFIYIELLTGDQYYFANTIFKQKNFFFQKHFLKKYIPYKFREKFTFKKVHKLQNQLNNTIYFDDVNIQTIINKKTKNVSVIVNLTAKKPQNLLIGIGYKKNKGITGYFEWNVYHITNTGIYFKLYGTISIFHPNLTFKYIYPLDSPLYNYISVNINQFFLKIIPYTAFENNIKITYFNKIFDFLSFNFGLSEIISKSTINISKKKINTNFFSSFLNIDIKKKQKYNNFCTFIFFTHLSIIGSLKNILSPYNFLRNILDMKLKIKYAHYGIEWNVIIGTIITNSFNLLPPEFRFYVGGVNSLLGYPYKSLSPIDKNHGLIGGHYMIIGKISFLYYINTNVNISIFYNAGNSFNYWKNLYFAKAIGMGINWKTILGNIHVYFSRPILNNIYKKWRIDFSIGKTI